MQKYTDDEFKWELPLRSFRGGSKQAAEVGTLVAKVPMQKIVINNLNEIFEYEITEDGVKYTYVGNAINDYTPTVCTASDKS